MKTQGRALRTSEFIARLSASPFSYVRVGLVVPRYGHSAVERNRLKRRLREIVRHDLLSIRSSGDLVIWARPLAYDVPFNQLQVSLRRLRDRIAERGHLPDES